jgi:hypothetical protein
MPRLYPPDDERAADEQDFIDGASEQEALIQATIDKQIAESQLAVAKVQVWEESEAMLQRANELTAWKRAGYGEDDL